MDLPTVQNISSIIQPYAKELGEAAVTSGMVYTGCAIARGLGAGTTIPQELRNRQNYLLGITAGALTLLPGADITPENLEQIVSYLGAAATGAIIGGSMYTIADSARNPVGPLQNQPARFRTGASRGFIAFPIAYALLEYLAR